MGMVMNPEIAGVIGFELKDKETPMPLDPWIEYMEDQILKTEEKIKTLKRVVHTLEADLVAQKLELDKYQGI